MLHHHCQGLAAAVVGGHAAAVQAVGIHPVPGITATRALPRRVRLRAPRPTLTLTLTIIPD